ncbi:MAG: DUF2586 family protein [Muribaculaceae bacterium]|nr:DUF2586 family protein [Muribaculaceae bacterium]
MNRLTINRENGNVPKALEGEDHVSGLVFYTDVLPTAKEGVDGFSDTERIKAISTIDKAEAMGITAYAKEWDIRVLHYQLSEAFRLNAGISLYVGIFEQSEDFTEIKTLQNYSDGRLRQVGIWAGSRALAADDLTAIQAVADALDKENAPLSVIYSPKVAAVNGLPTDLAQAGLSRVSVVIAQAGSGTGAELYADAKNTDKASVGLIGVALGVLSAAKVHQAVSWVGGFPTGVTMPAFADGTLYRSVDKAAIEQLDAARYIFLTTYPGIAGSYISDSHTMDVATSDYAYIEAVRVMDKAVRGIRVYVTPELGGNVYIDAESGKLQPYSCAHLETVAGLALEQMAKDGEISGYSVAVDPEQDVLSTSTIEIVVKIVQAGVTRKINVKIGYTKSL